MPPDSSDAFNLPCKISFFATRDPGQALATTSPGLLGPFFLTSPFFFEEVSIYQHFPDSLYPCVRQAEGSCVIASCCDRMPNRNQLGWGRFIWALDSERSGLCSWAKFIMVAERGMLVPVGLPPSSSYSIWTLSLCKVPSAFRVNPPPPDTPRDRPN